MILSSLLAVPVVGTILVSSVDAYKKSSTTYIKSIGRICFNFITITHKSFSNIIIHTIFITNKSRTKRIVYKIELRIII